MIETLEPRTLLSSTYTVNSLADDGSGGTTNSSGDAIVTLRYAIEQSNIIGGDQVIGFDPSLFVGGTATIDLTGSALELDDTTGTLTIQGPTGTDGLTISAQGSSGVFTVDAGSTADLDYLNITGGSSENGGGIENQGDLSLKYCTITGNTATADGGGIDSEGGQLNVVNSNVSGNSSYAGGGIHSSSLFSITGSQLENNYAWQGGAVNATATVTISSSTVEGNNAGFNGAGIYTTADLVVNSSTISGNTSYTGAGIYAACDAVNITGSHIDDNVGGGINMWNGSYLNVTGSTVDGNVNRGMLGGGIYMNGFGSNALTITCSTISGNSSFVGGGLYTSASLTNIATCTFSANTAYSGGAISNTSGALDVTASTFTNNYAIANGGGVNNWNDELEISSSDFSSNTAAVGGAVNSASPTTINATTFANNTGSAKGGALYGGQLNLTTCTITGNASDTGGGVYSYGTVEITDCSLTANSGSAITASGSGTFTVSNSTISGNSSDDGGGIYATDAATLTIADSTISGNSASDQGGGIYLAHSATLLVTDCTVSGNSASHQGGGIYCQEAQATICDSQILDNSANVGAGIFNAGTITLEGTSVNSDLLSATGNTGTIIFDQNTDLSGFDLSGGTYEIASGATAQVNGALAVNASLVVDGGSTLQINSGGSVDVQASLSVNNGSTLNLSGGSFTVEGSLSAIGGSVLNLAAGNFTVAAAGDFSIDDTTTVNLTGGSVIVSGEVDDTGFIYISGGGTLQGTGTVNLGGTTNVSAGGLIQDTGTFSETGMLTIADGGTVIVASGSELNLAYGTVSITTGGDLDDSGQFGLTGATVDVDGGDLTIEGSTELDVTEYSAFAVSDGGTVTVVGTLIVDPNASVQNDGILDFQDGAALFLAGTLDNTGAVTIDGGDVVNTGALESTGTGTFTLNSGATLESYANMDFTQGSVFNVAGGTFSNLGLTIFDQGTLNLSSGSVVLESSSTLDIRNGGLLALNGGAFTNQHVLSIDSGGELQASTAFNPGTLNIDAMGLLNLANGSSLTGGVTTIEPGATLLNTGTLDLSDALSSGILVLAGGSSLVNEGALQVSGNLDLGAVNFQNDGSLSLDADGSVSGGGTYIPPVTSPYSYSIYGGIVSGTVTQPGSDTYSYDYTPTSETYSDDDTDTATYSDTGSSLTPLDGGTADDGTTDSGGSTFSDQDSTDGSLVDGAWVWSGTITGSSSDHGSSTYSDHGNYVEYVDGFRVAGTTNSSGGSNWSDSSNWSLTINADGSCTINSDNNSYSGDNHSNFTYDGGDSYDKDVAGISYSASTDEGGSEVGTGNYNTSCNFISGSWVYGGTSSGTWNNSGHWDNTFSSDYDASMTGESVDGGANENIGENWTSNGSSASTLNANGTWAIASGSDTDTDHHYDNGGGSDDAEVSSRTSDISLSGDGSFEYTDDETIHANVSGGAWVSTGTGSSHSHDSGEAEVDAGGDYASGRGDINGLIVSGTANETDEENYSDTFDTNSTLAANGTVTTTGSGSSHQFISVDFSYGGGGTVSYVIPTGGSTQFGDTTNYIGTGTFTENGMQDQSSDLTTTWVLDPSGSWRADTTQDVEIGETQSNSQYIFNVSATFSDGTKFVGKSTNQQQSDYTYNDHINIATAINGVQTFSGTGSGNGTSSVVLGYQSVGIPGDASWGQVFHRSTTAGGNWTQNYSQNTLNISTGVLTYISYWDSSGDSVTISDPTPAGLFIPPLPFEVNLAAMDAVATTFNTAGTPSYGQIGSPTVTSVVQITPVPNYGTVTPSDPNDVGTPSAGTGAPLASIIPYFDPNSDSGVFEFEPPTLVLPAEEFTFVDIVEVMGPIFVYAARARVVGLAVEAAEAAPALPYVAAVAVGTGVGLAIAYAPANWVGLGKYAGPYAPADPNISDVIGNELYNLWNWL